MARLYISNVNVTDVHCPPSTELPHPKRERNSLAPHHLLASDPIRVAVITTRGVVILSQSPLCNWETQ